MDSSTQTHRPPAPGTEYPFAVSDIGHAAVARLGDGWKCEAWRWGVGAFLEHEGVGSFHLGVDDEGDLGVRLDESKVSPDFYADSAADGLDAATDWLVGAIDRLVKADARLAKAAGGQA